MVFVKLKQYPYESYSCVDWAGKDISTLGQLFTSDLGCPGTSLDYWIFDDEQGLITSGNSIELEKEDDYIYLSNMYDERKIPTRLKISRRNLFNLLYDWQNKVCKKKPQPQEVIIKYENDIFTLDTID
jgi:hypothetical protein